MVAALRRSWTTATPVAAPPMTSGTQPWSTRLSRTRISTGRMVGMELLRRNGAEQMLIDQVAEAVNDEQVHLMDARCGRDRNPDLDVAGRQQVGQGAAFATGQGNDLHAAFVGSLDRGQHVLGVSAGADRQQHVAALPQCTHLPG